MKIAVLGGGHGCCAAAADLSEQGHEVRWWRRDAAALAGVRARGGIDLTDAQGTRQVPLALASDDLAAVMFGAELVLIPLPATAQREIAQRIAPHLTHGQVVFVPPGTFGSVIMDRAVRAAGSTAQVLWAETGTLPYLARKHGDAGVRITVRAVRLPTGVYPAAQRDPALAVLRRAYPSVGDAPDVLAAALLNAGPIIHPPLILLNAAPLQHFTAWDIHNEGTQAAVRSVTGRLDQERIAVREALGYAAPHFPLSDHYDNDRWMYGDAHQKLVDSGDWREPIELHTHRYMLEDTVMGLAFLASVARRVGVEAPLAHGLLAVAGAVLGRELRFGERTLDALGLARLELATLRERLQRGGL